MKTKYGIVAVALATICLLAASVLADPTQRYGLSNQCQRGGLDGLYGDVWMLLVDDATRDNFQNMTLFEIKELREQKTQELRNMTLAEIDDLRALKMQEFENMTLAQLNETRQDRMGKMGRGMMGRDVIDQGMMDHGMMDHGMMDQGMMNQDMIGQSSGGYR